VKVWGVGWQRAVLSGARSMIPGRPGGGRRWRTGRSGERAFVTGWPFARRNRLRHGTSPVFTVVSFTCRSMVVTGLAATRYSFRAVTPSASAVMTVVPGLSALTLPNRSTVATLASDDRHVTRRSARGLLSSWTPFALWASIVPT
jgi:hypothetical protein